MEWFGKFSEICVHSLLPGISDHSPLLVSIGPQARGGGPPFKFFNQMAEHKDFMYLVTSNWQQHRSYRPFDDICNSLKTIKTRLKELHHLEYVGVEEKIHQ